MPFLNIPGTSEQYALLSYDESGKERTEDKEGDLFSGAIVAWARANQPTHVFFFIHGWKGDFDAARDQYDRWIKAMLECTADRAAMPTSFKPLWIGLHWPSLPFGDEEISGADFDAGGGPSPEQLKSVYVERLELNAAGANALEVIIRAHMKNAAARELPLEAREAYVTLATQVGYQSTGPSGPPGEDGAPFDPDSAFLKGAAASTAPNFAGGGLVDGILSPLRQLSYWKMKKRARSIGESGMHQFVTRLMNEVPRSRFHLMGHSFGTIVVSGILGGPGATASLPRPVDSVALIQGAVSLWAFGQHVHGKPLKGYFNPWVMRPAIRGPLIVSRSVFDTAVGTLYPWASAVSFSDGAFDVEDEDLPLYGAIGKYGIRALPGLIFQDMLDSTGTYGFEGGKIYNLEGSRYIRKGDGVSGAHSDIDGPEVAHAIWQAALV